MSTTISLTIAQRLHILLPGTNWWRKFEVEIIIHAELPPHRTSLEWALVASGVQLSLVLSRTPTPDVQLPGFYLSDHYGYCPAYTPPNSH
jgi:hypothetical protein